MATNQHNHSQQNTEKNDTILYVALDWTLVYTDTLHESIIGAIKKQPLLLLFMPFWLIKGKAYFKAQIAKNFIPNPSLLPYNQQLIEVIKKRKKKGHTVILSTAANKAIAYAVAKQTGLFDHILASDEKTNLKGAIKLSAIRAHCHDRPFGYAGDSRADLPIWKAAGSAITCGHDSKIHKIVGNCNISVEHDLTTNSSYISAFMKAIRPHQWAKNILVFTSIILSHQIAQVGLLLNTYVAFAAFCLCASGVYLLNDLLDIEADRQHKHKQLRPLASGQLPIQYAVLAIPVLIILSALLALQLPHEFQNILACYFFLTLFYSLRLKQVALLDVILLSLLYTIRIIAGSAAISISTTPWLLGFSIFLFLSLALAKRYSELHGLKSINKTSIQGRGYHVEDIEQLAIFGSTSGYLSVLVLALYINSDTVIQLYSKGELLWFICILLTYWISRIWLLARRGVLHEDPVIFTLHDRVSHLVGIVALSLLFFASL